MDRDGNEASGYEEAVELWCAGWRDAPTMKLFGNWAGEEVEMGEGENWRLVEDALISDVKSW